MLVVTRKVGERIIIGANAEIAVVDTYGKNAIFEFSLPSPPTFSSKVALTKEPTEESNSTFKLTARMNIDDIVMWENVSFMLVSVRGEQVRVGVNAPPEVRIYREEIWQRIKEEMAAAATVPTTMPVLPKGLAQYKKSSLKAPVEPDREPKEK